MGQGLCKISIPTHHKKRERKRERERERDRGRERETQRERERERETKRERERGRERGRGVEIEIALACKGMKGIPEHPCAPAHVLVCMHGCALWGPSGSLLVEFSRT